MAYKYEGYWKDVGTVSSLHEANMDLLPCSKNLSLEKIFNGNVIYSEDFSTAPQFISKYAKVSDALINQGAFVFGTVKRSVISNGVYIERGSLVENSVIMANAEICKGAIVKNAVIGPGALVKEGQKIEGTSKEIALFVEREEK
jgi:glucose-1-phosphate adenylyltransferase